MINQVTSIHVSSVLVRVYREWLNWLMNSLTCQRAQILSPRRGGASCFWAGSEDSLVWNEMEVTKLANSALINDNIVYVYTCNAEDEPPGLICRGFEHFVYYIFSSAIRKKWSTPLLIYVFSRCMHQWVEREEVASSSTLGFMSPSRMARTG